MDIDSDKKLFMDTHIIIVFKIGYLVYIDERKLFFVPANYFLCSFVLIPNPVFRRLSYSYLQLLMDMSNG